MWRDRLGLAAGPSRPVAAVQAPAPAGRSLTERSLDSLRQQRDAEDERAARTQTELDNTLAQISVANQGGARKVPPPPLPPPAPPPAPPPVSDSPIGGARADSRGSGGAGAAGGQQAAPAPQGGQDDLLAAIRGGVAQRAERGVGVAELEGRLQERRGSGGGVDAHAAQLSDALSGLRRQIGPRGSDSESDEAEDEDGDDWLSDDDDVPTDATQHYWARPRAFTSPVSTAPAPAPARAPAPAPAPAPRDQPRVDLPPGVRLNGSSLRESMQSRSQEPEWLPQRRPLSPELPEPDDEVVEQPQRPSPVQQAQARVLSDPELHAILARRRATTDAHAIVVATPESVMRIGDGRAGESDHGDRHQRRGGSVTDSDGAHRSRRSRMAAPDTEEDSALRRHSDRQKPRPSAWDSGGIYSPENAERARPQGSSGRRTPPPPVDRGTGSTTAPDPVSDVEAAVIAMGFSPAAVHSAQARRARTHGGAGYSQADELLSAVLAEEQGGAGTVSGADGGYDTSRTSQLEQERAGLLRAQRERELQRVTAQIAERQATFEFLQSSVSGHQLQTMAAEMEALLDKQSKLEAELAQGSRQGHRRAAPGAGGGRSRGGGAGAGAAQTVLVQIPPHISSGQQLQVTLPDGRPFIFIVPPGVTAGQSVELSVPPPDRVVRVNAQPAPTPPSSSTGAGRDGGGAGGAGGGWRNAAAGTLNRLGGRIKSPRGQSEARARYQRKLDEAEATLRTLQSMGENTTEVEREIKAMRTIIEAAEVETASGGGGGSSGRHQREDPELAAAKAMSLTQSESETAVLTKEQRMLEQAIEASHRSAVEDEVRRKEFLADQIGQLEAQLLSEREAERSAAADWPPITHQLRTDYNGHFVQLCGAGGLGGAMSQSTVSAATVWDFLQMSSLPEQTLRGIFELTVADHQRGVDVEEFMLAMHITKGVTKGLALPARLPAHLLRGGDGESERVLELEAALAAARAEVARGPDAVGGGAPSNGSEGDDRLRSQLQEMEAALAAERYERQLLENERADAPAMGAVMGGGGGGGLSEQEVSALRAKVALLQKQLGDLQTDEDSDEWDGTLESAHVALREAAERLMEGDESVQPEFDKWDKRISTHPDHLAAEARKLAEWER